MSHFIETVVEPGEAAQAQLLPWTATTKTHFVRVSATRITGRRFRFGPEPAASAPAATSGIRRNVVLRSP